MLSGEQVEGTSNADSCQAIATPQETIQTVTTYTGTVATTPVRRTFEDEWFLFFKCSAYSSYNTCTQNI